MSHAEWLGMQRDVIETLDLEQPVVIYLNDGTDFTPYAAHAIVRGYTEQELAPDSTIKLGDMKLMISADRYPDIGRDLESKDRVYVNDRMCSIIHFDKNTRNIAGESLMYVVTVR